MALRIAHIKRKRAAEQARKMAKEKKAEQERASAELLATVKGDALKLAAKSSGKSRLPKELDTRHFDELPLAQRISILEDYVAQLRELGARLSDEYGNIEGAQKELSKITDLINTAGAAIVRIELANLQPKVPSAE